MRNKTRSQAAWIAVLLACISADSVQAQSLSRVLRQLSGFGGRFYLTQVETGVRSVKGILGSRIKDQASYLRFMRAIESGRLTDAEMARMSREIRELDREAAMVLKGKETAAVRFSALERAALSAGLSLESSSEMVRLSRFFPAAPLRGSLLSARAELLAAGRAVSDREAARLLRAVDSRINLLRESARTDAAMTRRTEVFKSQIKTDQGMREIEIEIAYRNHGTASQPVWTPDPRTPAVLRSQAWGEGREVALELLSIKPKFVIVGSAGANVGLAREYRELTYIAQFPVAERPLEVMARIRGRKAVDPQGRETWDFSGSVFDLEAGALTTGL